MSGFIVELWPENIIKSEFKVELVVGSFFVTHGHKAIVSAPLLSASSN